MEKEVGPGVKKLTVGLILSWVLGVLAAISGVSLMFSQPLAGVLMLVLAAVLLPPANKLVAEKFKFSISGGLKFILVIVLLGLIGTTMSDSNSGSSQTNSQEQSGAWYEVKTFSGKGNQNTSSFQITGDKVKITATTCCGGSSTGTYSGISLNSDNGGWLGAGLSISTDGSEQGHGETTYRNLKPGNYYVGVITGVNWEVKVEEYR